MRVGLSEGGYRALAADLLHETALGRKQVLALKLLCRVGLCQGLLVEPYPQLMRVAESCVPLGLLSGPFTQSGVLIT